MFELILRTIDTEIERLQKARNLLAPSPVAPVKRGPGRPAKTAVAVKSGTKKASKCTMSPEARERIRQAQIKRWAKSKKST